HLGAQLERARHAQDARRRGRLVHAAVVEAIEPLDQRGVREPRQAMKRARHHRDARRSAAILAAIAGLATGGKTLADERRAHPLRGARARRNADRQRQEKEKTHARSRSKNGTARRPAISAASRSRGLRFPETLLLRGAVELGGQDEVVLAQPAD